MERLNNCISIFALGEFCLFIALVKNAKDLDLSIVVFTFVK